MQLLRRQPHPCFLTPGPAELVLVRPLQHQHTRPIKELQYHPVETAIAEHGVIAAQRVPRLLPILPLLVVAGNMPACNARWDMCNS